MGGVSIAHLDDPATLAALVHLVALATLGILATLKRSRPCRKGHSGMVRHHQEHQGTL